MNDNYLWDRTGEPDQETQQLEKLLGELRYQPRTLKIPKNFSSRRRSLVPGLAIAATLLLALAIGLWLNLSRRAANQLPEGQVRDSRSQQVIVPAVSNTGAEDRTAANQSTPKSKAERHQLIARSGTPAKRPRATAAPKLTTDELAQKEQLVFALRMVSAKLNLAQRKTLAVPQTNIIRNQHKVG